MNGEIILRISDNPDSKKFCSDMPSHTPCACLSEVRIEYQRQEKLAILHLQFHDNNPDLVIPLPPIVAKQAVEGLRSLVEQMYGDGFLPR